jgi:hypothetical protein
MFAILIFYILKDIIWTKVAYFSTIDYNISIQDPQISDTNVVCTSQVSTSVMFLLVTEGN